MTAEMTARIDPDELKRYSFNVWNFKQGEMVSLMIHIGDRLGLYRALAGAGAVTASELAGKTGLQERWLLEWLRGQAAARLLETETGERFELSPVGAAVLADEEDSLAFAAGAFSDAMPRDTVDKLVDAFRTGIGLSYEELGPNAAHRTERMLGPWVRQALVPEILPALDGVVEKLERGAVAADVGCGGGLAIAAMAEAFPNSEFHGYDPSAHAIDRCREKVAARNLDNLKVFVAGGEQLPQEATYDFLITFDCVHDMTRPRRGDRRHSPGIEAGRHLAHQGHPQHPGFQGKHAQPDARDVLRLLGFRLHVFGAVGTRWRGARHPGVQSGGGGIHGAGGGLQPLQAARLRRSGQSVLRSEGLAARGKSPA